MVKNKPAIFTEEQAVFFQKEMCIKVDEFESDLYEKFPTEAPNFRHVVDFLLNYPEKDKFKEIPSELESTLSNPFHEKLTKFLEENNYFTKSDDDKDHYPDDLLKYFILYYTDGLRGVFLHRQANYNGPRIYLDRKLSTDEDLAGLAEMIVGYRGMERREYLSNSFGMSWSLNMEIAEKFAKDSNSNDTVVVKANIPKTEVLLYVPVGEMEIVVKDATITSGEIVWQQHCPCNTP